MSQAERALTSAPALSHSLEADKVAELLRTDRSAGLSIEEAAARLQAWGPNSLQKRVQRTALRLLLEQFTDPLVILLLIAAGVSIVVLGDLKDAAVITAIVVLNGALGFIQQYRADRALNRLQEKTAPTASVIRSRRTMLVPASGLAPGDLITVRAGDLVPADARISEAHHLTTAEAILTGEAFPQSKATHAVSQDAPLAERASMLHMGTSVLTGRGLALVTATASSTAIGQIAALLAEKPAPTPLQKELWHLGRILGAVALAVAAGLFVLGWLEGYPPHEMFLTAVAVAVAAVPEGLPAVVTITLARGVQRLAAQSAIVRRLQAVETLGAATVICTDKTGTLTQNRIQVHEIVLSGLRGAISDIDAHDPRAGRYAQVATLCNDAAPGVAGGDPIETALLDSVAGLGFDVQKIRAERPRLDEAAFDSQRKLMSTLHASDGSPDWMLAVKGAAEIVIARSRSIESATGPVHLDAERREQMVISALDLAGSGLRTIGLAYRLLSSRPHNVVAAEHNLALVGLVALSDELRPEACEAIRVAQRAGIRVVMITGDHSETAASVAAELGIKAQGDVVLPGDQLSRLSAEQLSHDVHRYAAYARVDPADKVKIVRAWQRHGDIVAMTGDGVNDAPALRSADIGVAMGSGSDVSRDAAAIVLADDNFATLVSAVREGRGIFENLRKVIRFLLTTNASELLVMAVGFLVFGSLGEPLLPAQILWINLVTDGMPVLALAADSPRHNVMRRGPDRQRSLLDWRTGASVLSRAGILAVATLSTLVYGHFVALASWPRVQTIVFTTLVLVQLAYAFVIRAEGRRHPLRGATALIAASLGSLALQIAVVYSSIGRELFHLEPLYPQDWAVVAFATGAAMAAVLVIARIQGHSVDRLVSRSTH